MSWVIRSSLQREAPDSLGAQVERLVPSVGCRYCGAKAQQRCRTKSGAVDPLYHMPRHDDASTLYAEGSYDIPWFL